MRWTGHVARTGEKRFGFETLKENYKYLRIDDVSTEV
jgi:hypothetical protein